MPVIVPFSKTWNSRRIATRQPGFCLTDLPSGSPGLAGFALQIINAIPGGKLLSTAWPSSIVSAAGILSFTECDVPYGERKSERVDFERGIPVFMMGIDGTWRRNCLLIDVSQTGARLSVEGSLEGLDLREFFLLLSSTGLAYRRCRMVRLHGDQIGVEFLKVSSAKSRKQQARASADTAG
jgi:hypothetical protein